MSVYLFLPIVGAVACLLTAAMLLSEGAMDDLIARWDDQRRERRSMARFAALRRELRR